MTGKATSLKAGLGCQVLGVRKRNHISVPNNQYLVYRTQGKSHIGFVFPNTQGPNTRDLLLELYLPQSQRVGDY